VYDAELDGKDVTFGTSGFLYQNNKLMYDRPTDTLWHSLTGEPVVGELAHSGVKLDRFPVTHTTWERWLELHPDTTVVSLDTGFERRYFPPSEPGSAYFEYRASPEAMFPVFSVDDRLPEKDMVVGIASGTGEATAFLVEQVVAERVINTAVGDVEAVLIGNPGTGITGVYERGGLKFQPGGDPRKIIDESGSAWTATDDGLISDDGRSLARIPARELFWFAWVAFFPGTEVYSGR
jgi:hypothetical protein